MGNKELTLKEESLLNIAQQLKCLKELKKIREELESIKITLKKK